MKPGPQIRADGRRFFFTKGFTAEESFAPMGLGIVGRPVSGGLRRPATNFRPGRGFEFRGAAAPSSPGRNSEKNHGPIEKAEHGPPSALVFRKHCRNMVESSHMSEIVFIVEEDPDGGFMAKALGESIFTQADDMAALREMVRDAVRCHFPDASKRPKMIRLHFVSDEVIAA